MTTPLVSIIIPCYNAERYVGEAIRSALDQAYPNVEVIVIDDGSTDGSLEVMRSFGDAIRWETGPNRGASAARNRGVELARGELLNFLDADDLLHRDKLERQVPVMVAGRAEVVFSDCETYPMGHPEQAQRYSTGHEDGEDAVVLCVSRFVLCHTSLIWKSTLDSLGGFREDLPWWEDYELYLRLACAGLTFHRLPEALCDRRRVPEGSASTRKIPHALDAHFGILKPAYDKLAHADELTDERARAFGARMVVIAQVYVRIGQGDKARKAFSRANEFHPDATKSAYSLLFRLVQPVVGLVLTERLAGVCRRGRSLFGQTMPGSWLRSMLRGKE